MTTITVTTFYKFTPLKEKELLRIQNMLTKFGEKNMMKGLTLLAGEGINGTVSGTPKAINKWKKLVQQYIGEVEFKDSPADTHPFKRWYVKIREEIVQLGDSSIFPAFENNHHLTPEEWNRMMREEDIVLLDIRNDYEVKIGKFKKAVDLQLKQFQDFSDFVKNSDIPKEKKVLMYCTGGIRCEKALIEMQRQGYEHVYQLRGGILEYLRECPNQQFEGECFVFDHRASVDQHLNPSSVYTLCPHCGDPGKEHIVCARCGKKGSICDVCMKQEHRRTCSKDCAFRQKHEHCTEHV
jgi:UPF0176 protein